MSRIKRPSPAFVVAILALVAAVAVPAYALTKKEKRVVRQIANTQITQRAPDLAVKSAADAREVHSPRRVVLNDPLSGDLGRAVDDLIVAGPFTIRGYCTQNYSGNDDIAEVAMIGPNGSSYSGVRSDGNNNNSPSANQYVFVSNHYLGTGQQVRAGHIVAVAPGGQVVSVSASAEVNDPAGHCVIGVTAIGP